MRAGRAKRDGTHGRRRHAPFPRLTLAALLLALAASAGLAAEVRVLSGPGSASTITVGAAPDVEIQDRTPGAQPAAAGQGPASIGQTFSGEIALFLPRMLLST